MPTFLETQAAGGGFFNLDAIEAAIPVGNKPYNLYRRYTRKNEFLGYADRDVLTRQQGTVIPNQCPTIAVIDFYEEGDPPFDIETIVAWRVMANQAVEPVLLDPWFDADDHVWCYEDRDPHVTCHYVFPYAAACQTFEEALAYAKEQLAQKKQEREKRLSASRSPSSDTPGRSPGADPPTAGTSGGTSGG